MRKRVFLWTVVLLSLLAPWSEGSGEENYFNALDGCFLLYNVKTNAYERVIGDARCRERLPACSTFKVPLALMAFDAGVLTDVDQVLKWDGIKNERQAANQDHNARTWMRDSIVWFSQRLTPQIGAKKLDRYLNDFHYGNRNMSAGLTLAWLVAPDAPEPALSISAYEQVEFMRRFWAGQLTVSPRAVQITKDLTYLETSPKGFRLNGKTGSNFYADKRRLGWFIAHVESGTAEYIAVANFSDLHHVGENVYGGAKAKEITKKILSDAGLW